MEFGLTTEVFRIPRSLTRMVSKPTLWCRHQSGINVGNLFYENRDQDDVWT